MQTAEATIVGLTQGGSAGREREAQRRPALIDVSVNFWMFSQAYLSRHSAGSREGGQSSETERKQLSRKWAGRQVDSRYVTVSKESVNQYDKAVLSRL